MTNCNCVECDHQCSEYNNSLTSDIAYYEWTLKQDECTAKSEDKA